MGTNKDQNQLFPIFLKPEKLQFLIVGGGNAASEKLRFLLKSSPIATVRLVAEKVSKEILLLIVEHPQVEIRLRNFENTDLEDVDISIIATDDKERNLAIRKESKRRGIVTNVADTPALCDFYLGSIVTKGDLKIGISTNGKSPTMAKRIRQLFEKYLPEELPSLLTNMNLFRKTLKGDFSSKVKILNQLTEDLVKNNEQTKEVKSGKGPQLSTASYRRYITTGLPAHWGN